MSRHTAPEWVDAIAAALRARDIDAVPKLLILMALDGHGHEAEEARRLMLDACKEPTP